MVKCADCGFLAQHIFRGSIPQGFIDVEETSRETGDLPGLSFFQAFHFTPIGEPDLTPEKMDGDRFPTCFSRAFNLGQEVKDRQAEIQESAKTDSLKSAVKDVIHKERTCKQFVKWERGFTPKEHREMIDREWERKNDKKWHIIELVVLVIGAGLFTLLGAYIAR